MGTLTAPEIRESHTPERRTQAEWVAFRREQAAQRRIIVCRACGQTFHRGRPAKIPKLGNYCSETCRKSCVSRILITRRRRKPFSCRQCGAVTWVMANRAKRRQFCSRPCKMLAMKRQAEPNSASRGHGWQVVAKQVRERDKVCVICGQENVRRSGPVDHVLPFHFPQYHPNNEDNLALLCDSCHFRKTRIENRLFKGDLIGFIQEMLRIGYPESILHKAMLSGGLSWA